MSYACHSRQRLSVCLSTLVNVCQQVFERMTYERSDASRCFHYFPSSKVGATAVENMCCCMSWALKAPVVSWRAQHLLCRGALNSCCDCCVLQNLMAALNFATPSDGKVRFDDWRACLLAGCRMLTAGCRSLASAPRHTSRRLTGRPEAPQVGGWGLGTGDWDWGET